VLRQQKAKDKIYELSGDRFENEDIEAALMHWSSQHEDVA